MNQQEQATIDLVINGRTAETNLGNVGRAVQSLTRELRNMNEAEDPARYAELIERRRQLTTAYDENWDRIRGITRATQDMEQATEKASDSVGGFWERVKSSAVGNFFADAASSALGYLQSILDGSEAAYQEAEVTQTALQNKIDQTGAVAGRTKKAMDDLQQSLMDLTGIDDDVIAKGEDVALSYTNIRGVILDQMIPAAVNLASAQNSGKVTMEAMSAASEGLGKALDNPLIAKRALRSMGISLSEQMETEIKTLVRQNDVMGAQQIILDEVNKRYGNLAETLSKTDNGILQRWETRIGNIQEVIGKWIVKGKALVADFLSPFLSFVERIVSTPMSETLEDERIQMNLLVLEITDANTQQSERVKLINKLKDMYPDHLKNLDAEKSSNLEIAKAGERVNEMYINRIILAKKDEEIEQQNQTAAELKIKQLAAEQNMREQLAKLKDKMPEIKAPVDGTTYDKLFAVVKQYKEMQANSGLAGGGIFDPIFAAGRALKEYEASVTFANTAQRGSNKLLEERKQLMKDLGIEEGKEFNGVQGNDNGKVAFVKPQGGPTAAELEAERKAKEAADKKRADFISSSKELNDLYNEFSAEQINELQAKNDKELSDTEAKYDKLIGTEQKFLEKNKDNKYANQDELDKHQAQIDALQLQKQNQVNSIRARQDRDLNDKLVGFRDKMAGQVQTELEKEQQTIREFYDQQVKDAGTNQDQVTQIESNRSAALADAKIREEQRFQDEKKKIEGEGLVASADKDSLAMAQLNKKYDDEIVALKAKFSKEKEATQEFQDAIDLINKNRQAEQDRVKAQKDKSDSKQIRDTVAQSVESVAGAFFQISSNNRQREADTELKRLDTLRDKELANENLTESQRAAITEKYRRQEADIKKSAWEADKAAQLKQAIIAGALAVVKALPNPFAAVAAGVAAAAQVAIITAQEAPDFYATGGLTDGSDPAGYVNVPTLFRKRNYVAGEAGPEWIAPNWMLRNPHTANVMGALEALRQQGPNSVSASNAGSAGSPAPAGTSMAPIDFSPMLNKLDQVEKAIRDQEVKLNYQTFKKDMARMASLETGANATAKG